MSGSLFMEQYTTRALIEPSRSRKENPLPADAFLVFTPEDVALLKTHWPCSPYGRRLFLSDVALCSGDAHEVALIGPMLGAPQAVLVLEKIIALGVRRVIAYGWCGSLQPHVNIGDVIIPEGAHSEEGTSAHYPVATSPTPSQALVRRLENALESERRVKVHRGFVWSTDAPYRETEEKVLFYQRAGVLGVDMEMSALFTVAAFRQIDVAGLLVVSDDLSQLRWRHGFRDFRFQETRKLIPTLLRHLF